MALTKADIDALRALIHEEVASALPVAVAAPVATTVSGHIGRTGRPDGRTFPCTVDPKCAGVTYSAERSAVHGTDKGHAFRAR